ILWIPGDGTRKTYATLPPGGKHLQNSFVGHAWLVCDSTGKPLAIFIAHKRPGIATIEPMPCVSFEFWGGSRECDPKPNAKHAIPEPSLFAQHLIEIQN